MIKTLVICFLVFLIPLTQTFAQTTQKVAQWEVEESLTKLSPVRFLPGHHLYFIISLKETVEHLLKPDKVKKAKFDVKLLGKRVKEAYFLATKNDFSKSATQLVGYQNVSKRLTAELQQAGKQGQPVFEVEKALSDDLEKHLKIVARIIELTEDKNLKVELGKTIENIKDLVKLLAKSQPGIAAKILSLAEKITVKN